MTEPQDQMGADRDIAQADFSPNQVRQCRHGLMIFPRSDNVVGPALDRYGEFAEGENREILSLLSPGDLALDIGANLGTVTLPMAKKLGSSGRVIAFEPQRLIFQALCANLALNGITNTEARPDAVGSRPGTARMPSIDISRSQNFGAMSIRPDNMGEVVTVVTIDQLSLDSCALIKIDVEGMDYDVLLGGKETIERHRPYIYMEAKTGEKTASAIEWLQARDYDLFWHFAAFYSQDNYRQDRENIFGGRGDINMICCSKERKRKPKSLPRVASPESDWQADYQKHRTQRP